MKCFNFSFDKAFDIVAEKRFLTNPNEGFLEQLDKYEKSLVKNWKKKKKKKI